MEEVYGEKQNQGSHARDLSWSKSTRFLSHQGHQHQLSLMPLLESGGHHIPHSQSKYCKVFMESKFDEVCFSLFMYLLGCLNGVRG